MEQEKDKSPAPVTSRKREGSCASQAIRDYRVDVLQVMKEEQKHRRTLKEITFPFQTHTNLANICLLSTTINKINSKE